MFNLNAPCRWGCAGALVVPYILGLGFPSNVANMVVAVNPIVGEYRIPALSLKYFHSYSSHVLIVGILAHPAVGTASDQCRSPLGRRRPFILSLGLGTITGLLLTCFAELLVEALTDFTIGDKVPLILTAIIFVSFGFYDCANDLLLVPGIALINDAMKHKQ